MAIKLLPETLAEIGGMNYAERFKTEAKSMANLDHPGIVSVHDFGLAKQQAAANDAPALTLTNLNLGTPDFAAPETFKPGVTADHRADPYAVGVMLYQLLTGEIPRGRWRAPSQMEPGLDPRFDAVLNRALEPEPAERYANAAEFSADLTAIFTEPLPSTMTAPVQVKSRKKLKVGAVSATPAARVSPSDKSDLSDKSDPSGHSRKTLWIALGSVIGTVAAAFVVLAMLGGNEPKPAPSPDLAEPAPQTREAETAPEPISTPKPGIPALTQPKPGILRLAGNLGKGRAPTPEETRDIVACGADDLGFHAVNSNGELILLWSESPGGKRIGKVAPGGDTCRRAVLWRMAGQVRPVRQVRCPLPTANLPHARPQASLANRRSRGILRRRHGDGRRTAAHRPAPGS